MLRLSDKKLFQHFFKMTSFQVAIVIIWEFVYTTGCAGVIYVVEVCE